MMQLTIKARLFGLTISGLLFVACVSATGYWGITSVSKATGEVAGIGVAIRNHIEAGMYNDMTREDINQVCTKKGFEQQDAIANLAAHSEQLARGTTAARESVTDPALQAALDGEVQMVKQYLTITDALSKAVVQDPSTAVDVVGRGIQLNSDLQQARQDNGDLLEKSAKEAESRSSSKAHRAIRATFLMCGISLLLLSVVAYRITHSITRGLDSFSAHFKHMAEANDLTSRVDQDRRDEIGELGKYLNLFVEKVHNILTKIAHASQAVAGASETLSATSQQISANSESASAQAKAVSDATQQVSQNLQTVATGAEEMGTSIKDIAKNATEAAKIVTSAVKAAETANTTVSKLGESSAEIGQVIKVITAIAQQTNLLALNATIEAARAGEAGKGFAVVANEVKELAKKTAKATEDISRKIETIQVDTKAAVEAIGTISGVIHQINGISSTIATAVEEQSATTNEMARNVSEAAQGSGEITSNIAGVSDAAESTSRGAGDTQKAAQQLVETSAELRRLVEQFKVDSNEHARANAAGAPAAQSRAAHA
jgi:methyl-accepting chemotaxis protein